MSRITHVQAKRMLEALPLDIETVAPLIEYVAQQARGPADWEALTDRQHSIIAANRACEAMARVATLTDDVQALQARLALIGETVDLLTGVVLQGSNE